MRTEIHEFCRITSGTVLDAGAGCCRDAVQMARGGRDVVAVDAVPALLEAGPPHARVRPVAADVRDLPLRGSSVGAVWCSAVLLHMDATGLVTALGEFLRVLTPDGFAHISLKEGDGRSVEPMADSTEHRRHFFAYPLGRLRDLCADAGFGVDRTWTGEQADSGGTVQTWRKLLLRPLG
ncbi:class I SAM-dependent methyltransferase [Nocardiopsis sp. RSe5-2]|uniref:Class I SAM-dependent methyltransferase n=1 Tax=Nocardiopsis endophytica TaxID=3018445 RepID=A0ABT4UFK8_9ACTN|nr:class I SAM-dependent methyltransferase [Nocardiopsis endophytica]MDA2815135.1 class I SAM-dependent methyltransferase [Nocardiopsis endophytica]